MKQVGFSNTVVNRELHETSFWRALHPSIVCVQMWIYVSKPHSFLSHWASVEHSVGLMQRERQVGKEEGVWRRKKSRLRTAKWNGAKAEENEQWKYKSLNQKNKKFIRIRQREKINEKYQSRGGEGAFIRWRAGWRKKKGKGSIRDYLWGECEFVNVSQNRTSRRTCPHTHILQQIARWFVPFVHSFIFDTK